jgi:Asp/Glu/hydantoin racemase
VIKGQPLEVRVINPNYSTNVQEMAEKAWRSVNKEINIGGMTVKVRALTQEETRQVQAERKAQEEAARKEAREEATRRAQSRESEGKATTYSYVVGSDDDCPNIETKDCKPGLPRRTASAGIDHPVS